MVQLEGRSGSSHYDPSVGRWSSKDPILFEGGDTNLYGYTWNDPINYIDPEGTFAFALLGPAVVPLIDLVLAAGIVTGGVKIVEDLINIFNKQKGERGQTAKESGTDNPFKHLKPHPSDPNKVVKKDPHTGKSLNKPKPPGFDDYWKNKNSCP